MSFFEILVILLVTIFLLKPTDLPIILKQIQELQLYFRQLKGNILNYFAPLDNKNIISPVNMQELEQINFYLDKISALKVEYKGDYKLDTVKEYYRQLLNKKLEQELE